MRKVNKILDLKEQKIDYISSSPISMETCTVKHTPVHFHQTAVELIYCLEGEVCIRCNHEIVTLKKGQIFTVDFEDIHCIFSDRDNLLIVMHIDLKNLRTPWSFLESVYFACEDNSCEAYQQKPLQHIKNLLLATAYLYTKKGTLSLDESVFAADMITDILCEYFDWFNYINIYPNNNDEIRERFQAISAYCRNNFKRKVTIAELARTVHINENYLSQFIRKSPYGSFSNMIGYFRCFHAQYLLLTTELSVMDISNRCGFSDDKYFYKHFKLAWGQTPKEYRCWFREYIKAGDDVTLISNDEAHKIIEPYVAEYFSYHIIFNR